MSEFQIATSLAQLGNRTDPQTGAVSAPIYLSTTYAHPQLGKSTGYDYTRTKNPTREILEQGLAQLENGAQAIVTSSGMSAIQLIFNYFTGDNHFLVSQDLYGGSFRFFEELEQQGFASFDYFYDLASLNEKLTDETTAVFLETPTNPLMQEVSIQEVAKLAHKQGSFVIVDNTFLTPLRQKPLDEGADIVVHSGTKFLTGHNDILAGVVVAKDPEVGQRLSWLANTTGPTLSSFDCWLFIRSLKTFKIRFEQQEKNAQILVAFLQKHPSIKKLLYPGKGGMITFYVSEHEKISQFLAKLQLVTFAESLGSTETMITYPTTQTHADIPQKLRESYGLTPNLLRMSVGIEDSQDLITDLSLALQVFEKST